MTSVHAPRFSRTTAPEPIGHCPLRSAVRMSLRSRADSSRRASRRPGASSPSSRRRAPASNLRADGNGGTCEWGARAHVHVELEYVLLPLTCAPRALGARDGRLHQRSGGTHAGAFCQATRADRRGRWRWELRRLSGSMLCIGAGAPNLHLAGDPRKYCGDLPSGRGSLFNMETRGEQRARELGAPHMHMRIGLLRTFKSAARNRNQDRFAPADCPFRVESRVLMATHRVSARAHRAEDLSEHAMRRAVTGFGINQQHPTYGLGKVRITGGSDKTTRRTVFS